MVYPVLRALENGSVIRSAIALALRLAGILSGLGGVYALIQIGKVSFQLRGVAVLAGLLFGGLFAFAVFLVIQILFFRARSIGQLGDSPFTVIPVVSVLLRTLGEIYAALGFTMGLAGAAVVWLANINPAHLGGDLRGFFPDASGPSTFLAGSVFLLWSWLGAFLVLVASYFAAEVAVVWADIARNTRTLVKQSESRM